MGCLSVWGLFAVIVYRQVLKHENIISIDAKYIVDRWRKDIRRLDLMLPGSIC